MMKALFGKVESVASAHQMLKEGFTLWGLANLFRVLVL
jgi:hypothetical protein